MTLNHVLVWIDSQEARILPVDADPVEVSLGRSPRHQLHRHPKGATAEHNHPDDSRHFFEQVVQRLDGAKHILIVGPSTTKLQFLRYLQQHNSALESRVVGIESADHPTDRQLAAHAKHYFGILEHRR